MIPQIEIKGCSPQGRAARTEPACSTPTAKAFSSTQAQYAMLGWTLERMHRDDDGRVSYRIALPADRAFVTSHWHDVVGLLASMQGGGRC